MLNEVLGSWAAEDPVVRGQAAAFASTSGSSLGSGGMFFPREKGMRRPGGGGDGAGGASSQGGAGGGGRGGWWVSSFYFGRVAVLFCESEMLGRIH